MLICAFTGINARPSLTERMAVAEKTCKLRVACWALSVTCLINCMYGYRHAHYVWCIKQVLSVYQYMHSTASTQLSLDSNKLQIEFLAGSVAGAKFWVGRIGAPPWRKII